MLSLSSGPTLVTARMTKVDTEGGSHPEWNEKLVVDMPVHAHSVTVEVQCKTNSGNKVIGAARIPVSDFVGGYTPENYLHFLSYRLRDDRGERNGIINLSVRVKMPEHATCAASYAGSYSQPWSMVPGHQVSGAVVTGVPVCCGGQLGSFLDLLINKKIKDIRSTSGLVVKYFSATAQTPDQFPAAACF
ncbi:hypothetical protein F0562_014850 [Nyssa sinensis]|uniref:C2 domain-containing protein n=1 Tax=Nyssa sinensis TaxID=561372 RepID=A0A5J4ZRY7_9ASTE|nr:hypothetical protein F0562_014850 [Nyssa sinensis]